jgi:hypothetical protein
MIKSIIANFRRPTTEAAIGSLQKTLDQLDAVVVAEGNESQRLYDVIAVAQREREDAQARKARAKNIADRLAALLS